MAVAGARLAGVISRERQQRDQTAIPFDTSERKLGTTGLNRLRHEPCNGVGRAANDIVLSERAPRDEIFAAGQ